MSQSVLIVFQDNYGKRLRVRLSQTDQDAVTEMNVQDGTPDEVIKLMMLVNKLSMQVIQNMATAQADAKSDIVPGVARRLN